MTSSPFKLWPILKLSTEGHLTVSCRFWYFRLDERGEGLKDISVPVAN